MKRWWVGTAVVLVLGLVVGGLWLALGPDDRTTASEPPVSSTPAQTTAACEAVTLKVLEAAHPQKSPDNPEGRYLGFQCFEDRYVLARASLSDPRIVEAFPELADGEPVLFEFRDQAWRKVASGAEMSCGKVPAEAWEQWGVHCAFEPVTCRDSNDDREVTDMTGVGCPAALDVADRFMAANQRTGPWVSGEWTCQVPSRPEHAFTPNCRRSTDDGLVRLGTW